MDEQISFNEYVKNYAKEHNLTLLEISKKIGVSYQIFSKWLHGKSKPSFDNCKIISKEIGYIFNDINDINLSENELVNNIKYLLQNTNTKANVLASAINISYDKLMNVLAEQDTLTNYEIDNIANFFNISVEELEYNKLSNKKFDTQKNVFARNLREILTKNNISRKEFCTATNTTNSTLQTYLNAKCLPSNERLHMIAKYLNVDVSELMDNEQQKIAKRIKTIVYSVPSGKEEDFLDFANRLKEVLSQ